MSAHGPIATEIDVRFDVGDWSKSGRVVLNVSFVALDPNLRLHRPRPIPRCDWIAFFQ